MDWIRGKPKYNHGLTELQLQHKKDQLKACKMNGGEAVKCHQCNKLSAYNYHSFPKRGGTKYLFCCERCFYTWSDLEVSEEDYDFLSN